MFLIVSFIVIVVVSVFGFSFLGSYLNKNNSEIIEKIGKFYMSGLNERISKHFETAIEFNLTSLEHIARANFRHEINNYEDFYNSIGHSADANGFDYMALYSENGNFEMIYGEQINITDPSPFLSSIKSGKKKIAVGTSVSGEDIVIMGIPGKYPMKNGGESIGLVAAQPLDHIKRLLSLDEKENSLVFSHVIRRDGSFVIKNNSEEIEDNYFERIKEQYDYTQDKTPEVYTKELENALYHKKDYSTIFYINGERRHLYCIDLPYSEWFLVTVMPYGAINETVSDMSDQVMYSVFGMCGLILFILFVVFIIYFFISRHQIIELEKARYNAICATKAKSEFLSNMSHDIRTPMNAIVGMTAIAIANIDDKKQIQHCLKNISLSSKHLLGLINDVLDMSKIESGKMTLNMDQVSLREIIDSIVNIVQPQIKAKKQKFDVFIHDISTEEVYCDGVRLNQVLLNFLSNAVKFTPEGGSIHVSLHEEDSPMGNDYIRVHLRVKDTGIGMSKEFKEKVFESFAREDRLRVHKTEGAGLGMAITKYIIDTMGGTISVDSRPGEGTEFHVVLDLEKALVREDDMILPKWNMLVVDDDEQLCQSAISSLKEIGIDAEWTLDGETALKMVAERHKKHNDYHIILLDWKLPGIDGIETARRIQTQMDKDIPIILISAYDWGEIENDAKEAGISGFISKPLFKSTLFYGLKQFAESDDTVEHKIDDADFNFEGRHILLAEDNDLNWEIAEALLSELGLELERAENGQICVEKFKQSEVDFYDAILMDIRMPVMTGYEASEAIRALNRPDSDIPIIAMTADAFSDDIKKCLEYGMNAHIAKPIDVSEVIRNLEKYIKNK